MTAEVLAKTYNIDRNEIMYDEKLWTVDYEDIVHLVTMCDDKLDTIVLVGHNDTLSEAANYYTRNAVGSLKKSAMAVIQLDISSRADASPQTYNTSFVI